MATRTQPNKTTNDPATQVNPASLSWAEKVRVSDSSTRFTLDPIQRNITDEQLHVTEEMLQHNSSQWNRCMVGFIPGFRMTYRMVNTIASRAWRPCGLEQVTTMANGFLLFRFKTGEQMQSVLEKGPWLFGGKAIILQQWHPSYRFDKNKISKVPVWIRLNGLPFSMWNQTGLSLAASMVGRPLSCDAQTYKCTRLEYARLCVEIDAKLPKVTSFDIVSPSSSEPITVEVEYEWMPPHCTGCKLYGHSCKKQQQRQEVGKDLQGTTDHEDLGTHAQPPQRPVQTPQVTTATIPPSDQPKNPNTTIAKPRPHIPKPPDTTTTSNNTPITRDKGPITDDIVPTAQPQATRTVCVTNQADKAPASSKPETTAQKAQPKLTTTREEHLSGPSLKPNKEGLEGTQPDKREALPDKREAIRTMSKMDSLGSHSSMAVSEASSSSTTFPQEEDDTCPTSPPETVRKKKSGKKKKKVALGY